MSDVSVEMEGQRIRVAFDYSPGDVGRIKTIAGRSWKADRRVWTVPLNLDVCRQLREQFGQRLRIGQDLRAWAKEQVRTEQSLGSLASSQTATLTRLPHVLPGLYEALHLGPLGLQMTPKDRSEALQAEASYQAADVAFLAQAGTALNGNQPGLGKTIETIGAIWESGHENGSSLVIAPKTAVDGVWDDELRRWQAEAGDAVAVFACVGAKAKRLKTIENFKASTAPVKWLVVNPQMVQMRKDKTCRGKFTIAVSGKAADTACRCDAKASAHVHYVAPFPFLHEHTWDNIVIDECHKGSVRNHRTITAKSLTKLRLKTGGMRMALSGTPMKKRGADLWGTLHYLRPDVFTSYWNFADSYFEIDNNGFGKVIGGLRRDRSEAFFRMLSPFMLRRTKSECLTWLPDKQYVDVWCSMSTAQDKLYQSMLRDGMARMSDGGSLTTTSILAELTRLKQFAFGVWKQDPSGLIPTEDSCKLEALIEKMDEYGMFDEGNTEKQVVFSQSRKVTELVAHTLKSKGLEVAVLSGAQNKEGQRKAIKEAFQNGSTRVLCVVTTAGGVALTLDAASVAHFMDETWSPDEMEQAEDRIHRASRKHQVTIFNYRTKGTIDEQIMDANFAKADAHKFILDVRRQLMMAKA